LLTGTSNNAEEDDMVKKVKKKKGVKRARLSGIGGAGRVRGSRTRAHGGSYDRARLALLVTTTTTTTTTTATV
jgi:hypothetical protein